MATKFECDRYKALQDRTLSKVSFTDFDGSDLPHDLRINPQKHTLELCESCLVECMRYSRQPSRINAG